MPLTAIAVNCTLKSGRKESSTDKLLKEAFAELKKFEEEERKRLGLVVRQHHPQLPRGDRLGGLIVKNLGEADTGNSCVHGGLGRAWRKA